MQLMREHAEFGGRLGAIVTHNSNTNVVVGQNWNLDAQGNQASASADGSTTTRIR